MSQDDVENRYNVTYVKGVSYTVHMGTRDLVFLRRNKLYVVDISD